ncbi:NlpC/P60 family protein [Texcoconibacillus texcoconensis]|uniref:Peptidoglycan endopeptidase LytE n=1 Tax=Texcoconibacillus texcoconensis TaxID=1095777 RepID=A0A840QMI1_9BACI|nr:NlpC/P60 family protein [Texcoconibacillus texcoconensis]MBB5172540.1 peptidoglycan endopeptidase LytE [Texcoconibacillus texcoconensis]
MQALRKTVFLSLVIVFSLVSFASEVTFAAEYEPVPTAGFVINGETVDGIDPIKMGDTYYLPFREVSRILGYKDIKFEQSTKTYETTDGSTAVRITMGGARATKGDEFMNIDPPRWINDTAYVSLDTAGALYNTYITFNSEDGSIQVQKPAGFYRVQKHDTLWRISQIHHTTVDKLKEVNNLSSNLIRTGELLKLPDRDDVKEMEPIDEEEPVDDDKATDSVTDIRNGVAATSKDYIGAGYQLGATLDQAPQLFDCSSYTKYVFQQYGIDLPRTAREQASVGRTVQSLEIGDLVYFKNSSLYSDGRPGHVGIYLGDGAMISATTSRGVVIQENFMDVAYWRDNYMYTKRVIE